MDGLRPHLVLLGWGDGCLSLAAWSQNTEVLVRRWLIFPDCSVCGKLGFGPRVFISLDQSLHYLRLGNRLFVIKPRMGAFGANTNCMKSRKRKEKPWDPCSLGAWPVGQNESWHVVLATTLLSTPVDAGQQEALNLSAWTPGTTSGHFLVSWVTLSDPRDGDCLGNIEDRFLVSLGVRNISFSRSLETYSVPGNIQNIGEMGSKHQTKPWAPEALTEWERQTINIHQVWKTKKHSKDKETE